MKNLKSNLRVLLICDLALLLCLACTCDLDAQIFGWRSRRNYNQTQSPQARQQQMLQKTLPPLQETAAETPADREARLQRELVAPPPEPKIATQTKAKTKTVVKPVAKKPADKLDSAEGALYKIESTGQVAAPPVIPTAP